MALSKGFAEEARKRGVSRQAVAQAARAASGLCIDCGAPQKKGRVCCAGCLSIRAERSRNRRKAKGTSDVPAPVHPGHDLC